MGDTQVKDSQQLIQAMDIFTFLNLKVFTFENKNFFKCQLTDDPNTYTLINNAWLVGYITQVRVHKKDSTVNENGETIEASKTIDLSVSDGANVVRIVSFKTTFSETDFEQGQYYSFIVRPSFSKPNNTTTTTQNQGALISFHKITNPNEITAHISESIKSFYYMLAPNQLLAIKLIKAYTTNNTAITLDNLKQHLRITPESNDYDVKLQNLNEFLNFLSQNNSIIFNENGYMMNVEQ